MRFAHIAVPKASLSSTFEAPYRRFVDLKRTSRSMQALTLAGSPSAHSRSTRLLTIAGEYLRRHAIAVDTVRVSDLPASPLLAGDTSDAFISAAVACIARADVIVVGTPVYKAAYAGTLKIFLDLLPASALQGKVVLPIATGGSPAHMLAVDYALKPVLSALGARYVLGTVYVVDGQFPANGAGAYVTTPDVEHRLFDALARLVDSLHWSSHLQRETTRTAANSPEILRPDAARCSA